MGLRDKVALVFMIGVITQITTGNCMPTDLGKSSLKHYLDNFKHTKNNPVPKSPFATKGKTNPIFGKCKNAQDINQDSPNKPITQIFNFPDIEYAFDTSSRDPFHTGKNINFNPYSISNKESTNLKLEAFNNLKKEMRVKRKLNSLINNENYQNKVEMPSFTKFATIPECEWSKDHEIFPQVQYPTNAMETWIPHYYNPTLFNPYDKKNSKYSTCEPNVSEGTTIFFKPYKQQLRSKTKHFMDEIEKFKMRGSKLQSIINTKELNSTKTSTICGSSLGDQMKTDTSNVLPADKEPIINNLTRGITSNTDEKSLVNKGASNNYKSEDMHTEMETITSITEGIKPVIPRCVDNTQSQSCEPSPESTLSENLLKDKLLQLVALPNNTETNMNSDNTTLPLQEDLDASSISGPLNFKLPIPLDSMTNDTTQHDTPCKESKQWHVNNVPHTSIYIVPVGDSISKIQLPLTESNATTPIILILSPTSNRETYAMLSNNTPQTNASLLTAANTSSCVVSNISAIPEVLEANGDKFSNLPSIPMKYIFEIPSKDDINLGSLLRGFEILPNNSMCHISINIDKNDTSLPNTTDKSESVNSTHLQSSNVHTSSVPTIMVKNNKSMDMNGSELTKNVNLSDPKQNNCQVDIGTSDTLKNNTAVLTNKDLSETSLSENSSEFGSNEERSASLENAKNEPCVLKATNPPGTASLEMDRTDITLANTINNDKSEPNSRNLRETAYPDCSTDLGQNKDKGTANRVPVHKDTMSLQEYTNLDETALVDTDKNDTSNLKNSDNSADFGNMNEYTDAPDDMVKVYTSLHKDTNVQEISESNSSMDSGPNRGSAKATTANIVKNDTSVPNDMALQESFTPNNLTDMGSSNDRVEIVPALTYKSVSNSQNSVKNIISDNSTDLRSYNYQVESESANTVKRNTSMSKDTDVQITSVSNLDPAEIVTADTVNNDSSESKDISETLPSDIISKLVFETDKKQSELDNIQLDTALPRDIIQTNIVNNVKILPMDMEQPLTLLTDNTKISQVDKRLANTNVNNITENVRTLSNDLDIVPDNTIVDDTTTSRLERDSTDTEQRYDNIPANPEMVSKTPQTDTKIHETDRGLLKQVKSKFVFTHRSLSNNNDHPKLTDAVVSDTTKNANPLQMEIELPLTTTNDERLSGSALVKDCYNDTVSNPAPLDSVKNFEMGIAEPDPFNDAKDGISITTDQTSSDHFNKQELPNNKTMENNPIINSSVIKDTFTHEKPKEKTKEDNLIFKNEAIRGTSAPVIKEAPIYINKELTTAELKDLIKYLYVSV